MKTTWLVCAVVVAALTACPGPMPMPDGGTTMDGGTACPATAAAATWGMGTLHDSTIMGDETWTAADSPHRVPTRVSVGARVTIEPCAVVLLSGAGELRLDSAGAKVVAEGTAERPILIRGQATGATNTTRGLWTTASEGEAIRLAHVTIEDIGDTSNAFGDYAIVLQSQSEQTLHVDTVTIRNTYGGGIGLDRRARFSATSRNLTITGTKKGDGLREGMPQSAPVLFLNPGAVGTLPTGTYTGNEVDHIGVGDFGGGGENLTESTTWVNRGVPYFMRGGSVDVVPSASNPTWTIKEGVTLKFRTGTDTSNAHIRVGFTSDMGVSARLLVEGTADQKVTFEALSGTTPSWSGISIFEAGQQSRINHAVIRHTGLESRTAVVDCSGLRTGVFFGLAINFRASRGLEPSGDIVRNTTIRDAAMNTIGFQRSWIVNGNAGAMSVNLLDAAKGNAVEGLTCRQSGFSIFNSAMGTTCAGACE